MAKANNKNNHGRTFLLVVVFLCVAAFVGAGIFVRQEKCVNAEDVRVEVRNGTDYEQLVALLQQKGCLDSRMGFDSFAKFKRFHDRVRPGSYVVEGHMSVYDLVVKLRAGNQDPITITIGRFRTLPTLCQAIGKKMEFSADSLLALLTEPEVCSKYGCNTSNIISIFVQNSYEVYWDAAPEEFLDRMYKEYDRFWTAKRLLQADELNLTQQEVTTLASIVDEETNKDDEKALVASVYLNRIRKGMPLQADPTVKYAVGNFELRRILKAHTEYDSPYNTYLHAGLTPGPICIPSQSSIDAVLHNKQTDYLYFCASDDFSGYHKFASTLAEHNANAQRYHRALNSRNIR